MNTIIIFVALPMSCFMLYVGWHFLKDVNRKLLARRMIKDIEKAGPCFVTHLAYGVMAVCRSDHFEQGLQRLKADVEAGKIPVHERQVVIARPTFSFSFTHKTTTSAHVGGEVDYWRLLDEQVFRLTGHRLSEVDDEPPVHINRIVASLVREDRRLFVPWSSYGLIKPEDQVGMFPVTELEDAIAQLVRDRPARP